MSTAVADRNTDLTTYPVSSLKPSTTNTRGMSDWKLEDLVASVKEHGVLVPLLIRAVEAKGKQEGYYEIVAGHRRHEAAKKAGLERVPCVLMDLDEHGANIVQVIENLQRVDLHPYDEALGMKQLIQRGRSIEDLQKILGKPWRYVRDRLKLLDLCQPAALYLRSGELPLSHALLIAELPEARQRQLVMRKDNGTFGNVWTHDESPQTAMNGHEKLFDDRTLRPVSLNVLRNWIDDHVRFNAKECDAHTLFPETMKALATAERAELKVVMITHDHFVQVDARDAKGGRTFGPRSWKKIGEKNCPHQVLGVIAAGPDRGHSFLVCTEKKKCKLHWGSEIKASRKTSKQNAKASAKDGEPLWKKEQRAREEREKKEDEIRAAWKKAMPKLEEELATKLAKAPLDAVWKLATEHVNLARTSIVAQGSTFESRLRFLAGSTITLDMQGYWVRENGPKICRLLGVDWSKLVELPEHAKEKVVKAKAVGRGTRTTFRGPLSVAVSKKK